ncbi:MAG: hypothetical protein JEZ03_10445 [Bacteroidales bacterium]|nr:hypothetical protein [Bacteroidales bacterium]
MKKTYSKMPFPLLLMAYVALFFCVLLVSIDKMPFVVFGVIGVLSVLLISYKTSYEIHKESHEVLIYDQLLFNKINSKRFSPIKVTLLIAKVKRERSRGKGLKRKMAYDTSGKLVLFGHNNVVCFEKTATMDHLEELGLFFSENLNIELTRRSVRYDDLHVFKKK